MPLFWLKRHERKFLTEVLERYTVIEEEARQATIDDPNLETSQMLEDILQDYNDRNVLLRHLTKKFRPPVSPAYRDDYYTILHKTDMR